MKEIVLKGLDEKIEAARYHSLVAENVTDELIVTATSNDGLIMGVEHKTRKIYGVQFHPESIMTNKGMTILKNFLEVK